MRAIDVAKRYLEETRPCERNMWRMWDVTLANLYLRGIRLTEEDRITLENSYYDRIFAGKWRDWE